jgi:hypothetical protein
MAIDPSIALGVKPVQIESPINQMAKMYEMQNAVQSNELNRMKMDEYSRGVAKTEKFNNALAQAKDEADIKNAFISVGDIKGYQDYLKSVTEEKNLGFTGQKTQIEAADKKQSMMQSMMRDLSTRPSDANIMAYAEDVEASPLFSLQEKAAVKRRTQVLLSLPMDQRIPELASQGASAGELKPTIQTQNLNDRSVVSSYPAFGGAPKQLSSTSMGVSPNTTATINAAAEQGRLNRAAKLKSELDSGVGTLSPESVDFTAQLFMQTGQMPPLGMGSKAAALRKQVIERAAYLSMHPEATAAANPNAPGAKTPAAAPAVSAANAATNMVQNKQDVATQTKTLKDFSTGVQGQQVTSFNTALNHLDTLERLGNDLNNSDVRVVNKAANAFARELGVAAPASFDAAKKIVGAEIQKAIVRAGGTGAEREEAAAAFDAANSPAQLAGVFSAVKELLGGQLVSLKQQYDSNAGPKAKPFANKLNSAARKQLEALSPSTVAPASNAPNPHAGKSDAQIRKELGL